MNGSIRRLVHTQVSQDEQIAGMLASYSGEPAIFYQKAPSDSRKGWGEPRYPRVDFTIDMRQDPERHTAGTMIFNIWVTTECTAVGELDPDRAIEERLQELIDGTFYTGAESGTLCAEWERSDEFVFEGNEHGTNHPEVYGLSVTFELMAFPEQLTTDPDPVQGLNAWIKNHFPKMTAIAYDAMPEIWKPTDEHPAIYWRFESTVSNNRQSYAVTWYTGQFQAHVIAQTVTERNRWTKAIIERAQIDGEVLLIDESPMFINRITIRNGADPLREGQLGLTGQYGVLSQPPKEPAQLKLQKAIHNLAKEGKQDG